MIPAFNVHKNVTANDFDSTKFYNWDAMFDEHMKRLEAMNIYHIFEVNTMTPNSMFFLRLMVMK